MRRILRAEKSKIKKGDTKKKQESQFKLGKLAVLVGRFGDNWGLKDLTGASSIEANSKIEEIVIKFAYGRSYRKMTDSDEKQKYEEEYKHQLENQQAGINKLTVDK